MRAFQVDSPWRRRRREWTAGFGEEEVEEEDREEEKEEEEAEGERWKGKVAEGRWEGGTKVAAGRMLRANTTSRTRTSLTISSSLYDVDSLEKSEKSPGTDVGENKVPSLPSNE